MFVQTPTPVRGATARQRRQAYDVLLWPHDVAMGLLLLSLALPAWLPERFWHRPAMAVAALAFAARPGVRREDMGRIEAAVTGVEGLPAVAEIQDGVSAGIVLRLLAYLRELRPGGWKPQLELTGREHLERALGPGCGALLWAAPCIWSALVVKKTLHAAGYTLTYVGNFTHGPARSRIGRRTVNAAYRRIEASYIERRLELAPGNQLRVAKAAEAHLRRGGLLSVGQHGALGSRIVECPFLSATLPISTGAPSLALATGAALLPVFTRRRGPGDFEVAIEPPLLPLKTATRHEAVDDLARRFAALIARETFERPTETWAWRYVKAKR